MIYWFIKFISTAIFKLFFSYKIKGCENIPKSGPYIICTNHCSFLDPVVVCDAVPQRVYWVALKDLYHIFPLSIFLKLARCIPVNGAIREVVEALKNNKIVGIFIEGRRTYTGELLSRGKKGPALLAMRTGLPVLPGWINGTHEAYPRRAKWPKRHPISITFGKPIKFEVHGEEIINDTVLKNATAQILFAIGSLRQ